MHFIEKKAGQKRIDFDNKLKSKKILMGYPFSHHKCFEI